jgi:hypothetical protein
VHGGSFNHGPEKTAILGFGGARVVSDSLVHTQHIWLFESAARSEPNIGTASAVQPCPWQ